MSVFVLGVDTNVLVRFFTRDDPLQYAVAQRLVAEAEPGSLYIDPIIMIELNWVLRRVYGYSRAEVFEILNGLLDFQEFRIGDRPIVLAALNAATTTGGDFSDAVIALLHDRAGCRRTVTFDLKAQRFDQMIAVEDALP